MVPSTYHELLEPDPGTSSSLSFGELEAWKGHNVLGNLEKPGKASHGLK